MADTDSVGKRYSIANLNTSHSRKKGKNIEEIIRLAKECGIRLLHLLFYSFLMLGNLVLLFGDARVGVWVREKRLPPLELRSDYEHHQQKGK